MKQLSTIVFVGIAILSVVIYILRPEKSVYHPDNVTIVAEGLRNDGLTLHFKTPEESAYFCPGVKYEREGQVIQYAFVRSPVGRDTPVDLKAKRESNGILSVIFPFPEGKWEAGDRIELIDSAGRSHGSWTNTDGQRK